MTPTTTKVSLGQWSGGKDIMNRKKERSCVWCILLYPENETHRNALEYIKKNYQEFAWIKHEPEIENGKEHIHVVIRFKNYRWNTALAEELNIEINMFEKCRNLENALLYLIHFREPDKKQYSLEEVHGAFNRRLERIIKSDGKDNTDLASDIVSWIESQNSAITYTQLFYFCRDNGMYGELVRAMKLFSCIIAEHNQEYYEESHKILSPKDYPF